MFYLLLSFSDPSHNIYSNRWKMLETLRGFLFSANTSALQSWSRVWLGHQLDRLRLASSESIGYCATKLGDVLVSRSENKCQLQRENPSIILKPLCVNHCAQTPCNNRSKAWQKNHCVTTALCFWRAVIWPDIFCRVFLTHCNSWWDEHTKTTFWRIWVKPVKKNIIHFFDGYESNPSKKPIEHFLTGMSQTRQNTESTFFWRVWVKPVKTLNQLFFDGYESNPSELTFC